MFTGPLNIFFCEVLAQEICASVCLFLIDVKAFFKSKRAFGQFLQRRCTDASRYVKRRSAPRMMGKCKLKPQDIASGLFDGYYQKDKDTRWMLGRAWGSWDPVHCCGEWKRAAAVDDSTAGPQKFENRNNIRPMLRIKMASCKNSMKYLA